MVDYGERLKEAMIARQKTAQDVADHLGVSYQAVKKVLDGKTKCFSAPNHEDVCRFLRVPGRWLAKGEGMLPRSDLAPSTGVQEERPPYSACPAPPPNADEWLIEAHRILSGLSKEDRRAAVLQLRVFAAQLHTPGNSKDLPLAA